MPHFFRFPARHTRKFTGLGGHRNRIAALTDGTLSDIYCW
jgi:hypothetical protein